MINNRTQWYRWLRNPKNTPLMYVSHQVSEDSKLTNYYVGTQFCPQIEAAPWTLLLLFVFFDHRLTIASFYLPRRNSSWNWQSKPWLPCREQMFLTQSPQANKILAAILKLIRNLKAEDQQVRHLTLLLLYWGACYLLQIDRYRFPTATSESMAVSLSCKELNAAFTNALTGLF